MSQISPTGNCRKWQPQNYNGNRQKLSEEKSLTKRSRKAPTSKTENVYTMTSQTKWKRTPQSHSQSWMPILYFPLWGIIMCGVLKYTLGNRNTVYHLTVITSAKRVIITSCIYHIGMVNAAHRSCVIGPSWEAHKWKKGNQRTGLPGSIPTPVPFQHSVLIVYPRWEHKWLEMKFITSKLGFSLAV